MSGPATAAEGTPGRPAFPRRTVGALLTTSLALIAAATTALLAQPAPPGTANAHGPTARVGVPAPSARAPLSPPPTPTPTAAAAPGPAVSSSPGSSAHRTVPAPPTGTAQGRLVHAYVTGYSWYDNTPAGSPTISNPQIHATAGGTGTYDDPVTVAVGHSRIGGRDDLDWPAGTRFYVFRLRRYLIVEDTCGDGNDPQTGPCHVGYPRSASTWLDVWVGGRGTSRSSVDACTSRLTGVLTVLVDPSPGLPVRAGDIASPAGCSL